MRIISGFLKGKKINYLKNNITRPLKDSVKENLFNVLNHSKSININIERSNVLDLYSGFGSFGIECISRGAEKVTFVEKDTFALNTLKENLINLSVINKSRLINCRAEAILKEGLNDRFNIFFFDPPYADNFFVENLKLIKLKKYYTKDHIIIIHRERRSTDNFQNLVRITNQKEYGRSKILFGFFN
tara:strand:+ start:45 stop:605 length:561 start_codon:yes stop_codon:yes gene_type:complete